MTSACAVVLTETVDITELARVYRKMHAPDLHLADHRDPSVEERLRWTAEAPGFAATVATVDGEVAGTAIGVFQTYEPAADPIGEHYPVREGDFGIHLFLAPADPPIAGFTVRLRRPGDDPGEDRPARLPGPLRA